MCRTPFPREKITAIGSVHHAGGEICISKRVTKVSNHTDTEWRRRCTTWYRPAPARVCVKQMGGMDGWDGMGWVGGMDAMDGWDGWDGWVDGWMGWMGWVGGWMDGWMDG